MKHFKISKLHNPVDKARWVNQVWNILEISYRDIEGGLLFSDKSELMLKTSIWKVIVVDGRVLAVAVFKEKHGQKLVAMGVDRQGDVMKSRSALIYLLRHSLERAWMEVSEAAENFIMKQCGGEKFLIHQSEAVRYLNKAVEFAEDGYHYVRKIAGIPKVKIVLGTPGYY